MPLTIFDRRRKNRLEHWRRTIQDQKIETVPNVGVPFSPWLPAIHPFLQFTAPLPLPGFPLSPSGGGINYTVARDRTPWPFKFRLFPADAEIELGIGAGLRSGVQTMKERKAN